jgi:hypothetical protein
LEFQSGDSGDPFLKILCAACETFLPAVTTGAHLMGRMVEKYERYMKPEEADEETVSI